MEFEKDGEIVRVDPPGQLIVRPGAAGDLLLACDRVRLRLTETGASRRERLVKRVEDVDIKALASRIDRHLRHARVRGVAAAAGLDRARLISRVAARAEAVSAAAESAGAPACADL